MTAIAAPRRLSVARQRGASLLLLQFIAVSLLFLGTALIGVWVAYDRGTAWPQCALLGLAVIAASTIAMIGRSERRLTLLGIGCALVAGGIGVTYLLVADWAVLSPGDFVLFPDVGQWIARHRPVLPLAPIHSNAAGGALAIVIPLGSLGIYGSWRQRWWIGIALATMGVLIAFAVLVLTSSRGAWAGLLAGCTTAFIVYISMGIGQRQSVTAHLGQWIMPVALGCVPLLVLVLVHPASPLSTLDPLVQLAEGELAASGRLGIWRNMLTLIQDYGYTGGGMGSTEMVYSSYVLLLHVGLFRHAHNLFLQIAVEQGLPGLLAFAWLLGLAVAVVFKRRNVGDVTLSYLNAPLIALVALLIHGAVDAELYISPLLPVILLPVGMALAIDGMVARQEPTDDAESPFKQPSTLPALLFCIPTLIFAMAILFPSPVATFYANLGTVRQTQAELSVYRWPEWPVQDAVRRAERLDLDPAQHSYRTAIAIDADNVVANRRLGQIALSLGDYSSACAHLKQAVDARPSHTVAATLLGECYAVTGNLDEAAALWRRGSIGHTQIELRRWWYASIGEVQAAERIEQAATLMEQRQ